jgi:hypothetical protein
MLIAVRVGKIRNTRGKVFEMTIAQRPGWRPFNLGGGIQVNQRRMVIALIPRLRMIRPKLRVAEQQDVIGQDGLFG